MPLFWRGLVRLKPVPWCPYCVVELHAYELSPYSLNGGKRLANKAARGNEGRIEHLFGFLLKACGLVLFKWFGSPFI